MQKLDLGALIGTLLAAALVGAGGGLLSVQSKALLNAAAIDALREDVEEQNTQIKTLKKQNDEQKQLLLKQYNLLQDIDEKL